MATVSAKITGKVREVLIEEGQRVEAGQIMATLDPIDADAQRDLAASQVAAARSRDRSVQAQLVEPKANATRLDGLVKQQLVSKAQYDQAIAQRDALRCATRHRAAQRPGRQRGCASPRRAWTTPVVRAPFAAS
jgi:multidrug efflux pump subunit AcrA (membrane-fusion protein)